MSLLTDLWLQTYAIQTATIGTSPVIAIGAVTGVPVIPGKDTGDFTFFSGGQASGGQNTVQTLTSAWTGGIPTKGQIATITQIPGGGTVTEQVLSSNEVAGILYIELGDNSA